MTHISGPLKRAGYFSSLEYVNIENVHKMFEISLKRLTKITNKFANFSHPTQFSIPSPLKTSLPGHAIQDHQPLMFHILMDSIMYISRISSIYSPHTGFEDPLAAFCPSGSRKKRYFTHMSTNQGSRPPPPCPKRYLLFVS